MRCVLLPVMDAVEAKLVALKRRSALLDDQIVDWVTSLAVLATEPSPLRVRSDDFSSTATYETVFPKHAPSRPRARLPRPSVLARAARSETDCGLSRDGRFDDDRGRCRESDSFEDSSTADADASSTRSEASSDPSTNILDEGGDVNTLDAHLHFLHSQVLSLSLPQMDDAAERPTLHGSEIAPDFSSSRLNTSRIGSIPEAPSYTGPTACQGDAAVVDWCDRAAEAVASGAWKVVKDARGRQYFFEVGTKKTSWNLPKELQRRAATRSC